MDLPRLSEPARYVGLYVADFGERVAVGYTAREIQYLLEPDAHPNAKIFKILRAHDDGSLDLRGVLHPDFAAREAMLFIRRDPAAARADADALRALAEQTPPPVACVLELADLADPVEHAAALLYPADASPEVGMWLNAVAFTGGDRAEGGPSAFAAYEQRKSAVLSTRTLFPPPTRASRDRDAVLAATHNPLQR